MFTKSESEVAQSCPTLCDPMDCSLVGSSIHGIFQARVLEWGAVAFSRGSFQRRNGTWVSHTAGRRFTVWATREAPSVHSITVYSGKDAEATWMSIVRGVNKDVVRMHNGLLLIHKNEWNNAICSNMNKPRDYHTKWSQKEVVIYQYYVTRM